MNQPLVCVIILNWNGLEDTLECIESLKKITYSNYKIVIVDNASKNHEVLSLRNSCSQDIDIILNEENYGYTGGNNVGMEYALKKYDPEFILILNNDIIIDPDFLSQMVNAARSSPSIGIVGAKVYYRRYPILIQAVGAGINMYLGKSYHIGGMQLDKGQYDIQEKVGYVIGCCMLINSRVIDIIGLLDEQYFCYWDDSDYCVRCQKAGYDVVYAPLAKVWHKNPIKLKLLERSQNRGSRSVLPYYYNTRNNFIFMKKHANKVQFITFILFFFTYNFIFMTGACLIFHRDIRRYFAFIKGIIDGIKTKCNSVSYVLNNKKHKLC